MPLSTPRSNGEDDERTRPSHVLETPRCRLETRVRRSGGCRKHVREADGESREKHGSLRREHGQGGGRRIFLQGGHADQG